MKCPKCHKEVRKTDWLPKPGEDSILREYVCIGHPNDDPPKPACGYKFYLPTGRLQRVSGQPKEKVAQGEMFPEIPKLPKQRKVYR